MSDLNRIELDEIIDQVNALGSEDRDILKRLSLRALSDVELAADLFILPSAVERSIERLKQYGFVVIEEVEPAPKRLTSTTLGSTRKVKLSAQGKTAATLLPVVTQES